jgi:mono/diheme cytochrome c family protein
MNNLCRTAPVFAAIIGLSSLGWSQEAGQGETVYKQKCAMCHGAAGEGKVGPKLQATRVAEDDIVLMLSKGKEGKKAPHSKTITGLNDEQIKAVAHYVKSLK